jgi:hypothetical protein
MNAAGKRWTAFVRQSGLPPVDEAGEVGALFAPEMERYCELVCGPGGDPIGLMVRGEGISFTDRARSLLSSWKMPEEGIACHSALADAFEHKRAFFKLEWDRSPEGGDIERLASFYYRRRPSIARVRDLLRNRGVHDQVLAAVTELAALLDKGSVHFVSASLRPGYPVRFKLYFSQYLTPEGCATVLQRLLRVAERFDLNRAARDRLAEWHALLTPPARVVTIFVSAAFEARTLVPSFKIDYPDVSAAVYARLLPLDERADAQAEVEALCVMAGRRDLSYLGVRYYPDNPPTYKYYADLPQLA